METTGETGAGDGAVAEDGKGKTKRAKKARKRVAAAREQTLTALQTLEKALRDTAKEVKAARKLLAKD